MASAGTAMAAAKHMPKNMCSYDALDASDKGNYLATANMCKLQASPNAHILIGCPSAKISSPNCFLPWGKKGKIVSAVKFKRKLETRAEDYCSVRKWTNELYQVWLPNSNKKNEDKRLRFATSHGTTKSLSMPRRSSSRKGRKYSSTKQRWAGRSRPKTEHLAEQEGSNCNASGAGASARTQVS